MQIVIFNELPRVTNSLQLSSLNTLQKTKSALVCYHPLLISASSMDPAALSSLGNTHHPQPPASPSINRPQTLLIFSYFRQLPFALLTWSRPSKQNYFCHSSIFNMVQNLKSSIAKPSSTPLPSSYLIN